MTKFTVPLIGVAVLTAGVGMYLGVGGKNDACAILSKAFPDDTAMPGTTAYAEANGFHSNNTEAHPYCIFTPRDTPAVAFGVRTMVSTSTEFAIRSGGHSMNHGFASTSSGVLISLGAIKTIDIDVAGGTAVLGAGNTWGEAYAKLATSNVTVAGGRANTVGVGGLSLGGGLSFHLYEHGFGADKIVSYEVVTAAGKIITVNAESYADMFLALKGSGAPFALVTNFTYRLFPATPIWGGTIFSGSGTIPALSKGVAEFMATGIEDVKTHLIAGIAMQLVDAGDGNMVVGKFCLGIYYYRDAIAGPPEAFREMIAAQKKEEIFNTIASPRDVAGLTTEMVPPTVTRQMQVPWMMINPTEEVLKRQVEIVEEVYTEAVKTIPGFAASLNFIPVGEQGRWDNVLGLKKGVKYLQVHNFIGWPNEKDDGAVREVARQIARRSTEYLKEVGHFDKFIYMNYAWDEMDPIATYGEENIEKIRKVQEKYDPDGVWTKLVKGGFKVPPRTGAV